MFSVNDLQCGVVFHSGRNCATKERAMEQCGEMLIEGSHYETEEIRRITKAMRIPHKVFIESKMKILSRLR